MAASAYHDQGTLLAKEVIYGTGSGDFLVLA